ncbi:MAG TPA: GAF domain-containing protein [Bacteroidia bacterium]|jgi:L-methionine (R)-S-oxide reductase|nr:GAF domain-containing protein [Bacteroidia bacterium]
MAEELKVNSVLKKDKYAEMYPQIKALLEGENDLIANMANICSALKYGMNFFWVGFYMVKGNELVLGPFQGTVACTRIAKGKGVCGAAWQKNEIIIVDDVEKFPGHIACSALSRSEIVLPVYNSKKEIIAIFDVDSDALASFDKTDEEWLRKTIALLK